MGSYYNYMLNESRKANMEDDIKKQKLNIASFNDGKINANIELKWKRVLES